MNKSLARAKPFDVCMKTEDGELGYEALNQVPYDNRKLKEVIETLFGKIKSLEEDNKQIKVDRDEFMKKYQALQIEHDSMKSDVKSLKTFSLD